MDPMTPAPDPHPVAVVGAGAWGRNLVRNVADLGALRWVCEADATTLEEVATAFPGIRATTDIGEVLADEDVRGVVIATPAPTHAALATAAMDAGKDVLVEKPLALDVADARRLAERSEECGAVLMVGHILEYHPAVTRLVDLVRAGELGAVRYVYSNRLNLGRVREEENILWSFAPHDISVIERIVGGEPESVATSGGAYLQHGIADVTVTDLTFAGGVRGHVFVSWLHPFKEQRLVVIGDRKMAVFDGAGSGALTLYDRSIDTSSGRPVAREGAAAVVVPVDEAEPLRLECEHFLARIRDRGRPLTDGANGIAVLRVLEASQRSLERAGAPVRLDEIEVPA